MALYTHSAALQGSLTAKGLETSTTMSATMLATQIPGFSEWDHM